ncbi:hypothetical protein HPB52_006278 [Rhipicephalus sanguineus]|uniref:Uncharacterized protein n=1 Tax=Rhipicephalus sanguineus TaxID=34632 RepID=A0A9D4T8P6_RHISA|nr:hypothetical protein HPB52_006278 [Rhipicephalus sanguineus]
MGPKARCCLTVLVAWATLLLCFSLWVQKCGADSSLSAAPKNLRTEDIKGEETVLAGGRSRLDGGSNETEIDVARRVWKDQEGRLKAGIESFFKAMFPRLVRLGSEAEISTECQAAYFKMFLAVRQLKTWALKSE